jgi:manganese transport protein
MLFDYFKKSIGTLFSHKKPARLEIWHYIGPGLLVTIGFIDPGNWVTNIAAGSYFGYELLWIIAISTIMLIFFQHNTAHLGIVTGLCLAEATSIYLKPLFSRIFLSTAMIASISTALAEISGGAIALKMLFNLPIKIGAILLAVFIIFMIFNNSYRKIEKWIIGFVSLIGLAFIIELFLIKINYNDTLKGIFIPVIPANSIVIIMSLIGAVIMPHNLFLHSEIIQSRQLNLSDDKTKLKSLKYELYDTMFSMFIGFAINAAIIIIAASVFFKNGIIVNELEQAQSLLTPLLGNFASFIFAIALLFAGIASAITASMSGGIISAGAFKEPYDIKDNHTRIGIIITILLALLFILFVHDIFKTLIYSQVLLSIQLPITLLLYFLLPLHVK